MSYKISIRVTGYQQSDRYELADISKVETLRDVTPSAPKRGYPADPTTICRRQVPSDSSPQNFRHQQARQRDIQPSTVNHIFFQLSTPWLDEQTIQQLYTATTYRFIQDNLDPEEQLLNSVLNIPKKNKSQPVRIFHQAFRDFLLERFLPLHQMTKQSGYGIHPRNSQAMGSIMVLSGIIST